MSGSTGSANRPARAARRPGAGRGRTPPGWRCRRRARRRTGCRRTGRARDPQQPRRDGPAAGSAPAAACCRSAGWRSVHTEVGLLGHQLGSRLDAVALEGGEHDRRRRRDGQASASSGTNVPAADALLAASGPATPSMAPCPNSSRGACGRDGAPARRTGTSGSRPPAGTAPNGNPSAVPRSHGFQDRAQSWRPMNGWPTGMISSGRPAGGRPPTGPRRARRSPPRRRRCRAGRRAAAGRS